MSVKLKIIGCGDAFASGGQHNTCFYVEIEGLKLLIDCGATPLPALKSHHIKVEEIDFVLISHLHGDHFGGLPFIMLDMLRQTRKKKLTIIGPAETEQRTWALFDLLYPGSKKDIDKDLLHFREYHPEILISDEAFSVEAFPVIHTPQTYPHALKVRFGEKTISFSGDTSWCENLINVADGADIFICECNFFERQTSGHLSYQEIERYLPELNSKKIMLTHLGTDMLEKKQDISLVCLEEGQEITL